MRIKGLASELRRDVTKAKKNKDWNGAIAAIDAAVRKHPDIEASFGTERYFLLLDAGRGGEAATYGNRLVDQLLAKSASGLNYLAWTIVDPHGTRGEGDWALAVRAAERAVSLSEAKDANILDTLGLALFRTGAVVRAISVQERAVALAAGSRNEDELKARLQEFRNARDAQQP
jgi:hypothetical protein